ncbi:hypothetical protein I5589_10720 [Burkholderia vietnamiensis]|uniref:Uncharacterized protein n=1 Tax=Burkholderia vietnamiensis TaxID=60552 RepID=A0ABS1AVL1_BURVI|nr:hypothetical protein [Burkholderia vietnamiensis]MBJ9687551.1 hypothetical protein [Burkholderia vietnamiensis]
MSLQAKFFPSTEEDTQHIISWLKTSGFFTASTPDELDEHHCFTIELRDTPSVLAYLSKIGEVLSIARITPHGITFYLTDIPLLDGNQEQEQKMVSDRSDGFLFCPMSNVICFNGFGNIYAARNKK